VTDPSQKIRSSLRQCHLESFLDRLQDLLIRLTADERNTQPFRAEATGATDAVEIRVGIGWQIVVDGKVDALNVDATTKDIGGDANPLVEFLEFFVAFDTVYLSMVQPLQLFISACLTVPPD
jgi:hypothetical protein